MQVPSEKQNQQSTIGKSIVIKGEITATDPLYVYGRVEGSIKAPAQRVTIGKEGKLKANVTAREVVILGEVQGNVEGDYRVEVRSEGSLTGDLAAERICIDDGAVVKGVIDIRGTSKKGSAEVEAGSDSVAEPSEMELDFDREALESVAVS